MKLLLSGFVLTLLLLAGTAHALRLTDGLYFTVLPNATAEVYFILPDDLGAGQGKADYFITTETNWSVDLTEQTVGTEENNTAIIPIKFYSAGKAEGECSNYTVTISAPSLSLSRSWRGGVCLSKYMDADISKPGGDAKDVLNSNVDLFSLGFRTYAKSSAPGEAAPIELLVQSQASLTIDISLESEASLDQKSFVVQTGQVSQQKSLLVNATAASPGSYEIRANAKARGCSLASCTKQASMRLSVSDSGPQEGFSVSLFPENLAVKTLEPVNYSLTIQNSFREEVPFVAILLDKPLDLDSSFTIDTINVPALSERTVDFTATPRNQTVFYEIKMSVSGKGMEKQASAYLSTNEMASDIYRSADGAKENASASEKAAVDRSVRSWYSSYSKSEYGSNLTGYASLQEALENAKKEQAPAGQNQTETPPEVEEEPAATAPNYTILLLPAVIAAATLVLFLLFRKGKGSARDIGYLEKS